MSTTRRIIITGASGIIGKTLFAALRERGDELVIFTRNPAETRTRLPGAAAYVEWSPAASGPWAAAIDGAHAVIHLAGEPISGGLLGKRWTADQKTRIRDSRVLGTRGIVAAIEAAQRRPKVLVSASAIGYYGFRGAELLDEQALAGNDFLAQICVAWEHEAVRAAQFGVRVARVRTGILLDPEAGALGQLLLPFRLRTGGPVMPGSQYYSWIHPADELGLLLLALDDERVNGAINATAPTPETNRDFSATLGNVLGSPSWLPVPEFSLRLALGEMADLVIKGQRVLPRLAQHLGYQFKFPRLEPALRDLLRN